ncbi:DUF2306 domain-containing protein [Dyadobacter sediminis]|uniref:DUF2306 domain-containing protein n=1 Tax=Dyadobacter sediminis TaxID=1493691 RepID=A0A5R9KK97_9BACT|nr:DUF2306 domain-containing protein [Dyadobacter sediminis]TLU96642.1 DUF2306 domain-containing protein [Dyadobacter sediminis]GGB83974.1 hypothetical protein GCM10011325_09430 [Dyadobacter sediminis]
MTKVLDPSVTPQRGSHRLTRISSILLNASGKMLVITVWTSAALFGMYILAFYAAALYEDDMQRWNKVLPGLYNRNSLAATSGIGFHFAAGGIILVLGSIQLIEKVRLRFPAVHRWIGRIYIVASLLAAAGGIAFIVLKGTIGGTAMDIGFGLYGALMFVAAIQTFRYAVTKRLELHRAWALRLYALAIGSWLYRMDYGFWLLLTDGLGHTPHFTGPFDTVMFFFFYIPNLIVAEAFIRARKYNASALLRISASFLLFLATAFIMVGTYFFTIYYWGPAILKWLPV